MTRLFAAVALLFLAAAPLSTAALAKDQGSEAILQTLAPGFVRVEIDLQYDKGEPPVGVTDQDPGSRTRPMHSLAEVVEEERPLETTGFLIAPDLVVAMDPTIHPRFVKTIHVRVAGDETTATVSAYGIDQWAVYLKLAKPLKGTKAFNFTTGRGAHLATYYRLEGGMVRELLPFPSRVQQLEGGGTWRVAEQQGVAVTADGKAIGLVLGRHLPMNESWEMSPARWAQVTAPEYEANLKKLGEVARRDLVRVRLSFRSPKASPGAGRQRFRAEADDDSEGEQATERDVLGLALPGNRVLVLTALRPVVTARLQRIAVYPTPANAVPAKFVASLKDFGAFVVEPEKPIAASEVATVPLASLMEKLSYCAEVALQGENRVEYLHHSRINALRTGPRLEPYPEIPDMQDAERIFLFTTDLRLAVLPVAHRDRTWKRTPRFGSNQASPALTSAALIARAVADLPGSSDPANVPVSEVDENRLAWLGAELQPMTRELARANNVSEDTQDGETGALVTYVHPGSPAAAAGITPGAVLLRLRVPGEPTPMEVHLDEDMMRAQPFPWDRLDDIREQYFERLPTPWAPAENSFTRALTDLGFGRAFTLEYISDGKLVAKDLTVAAGPTHYESAARYKAEGLGLTVRDLTYDVQRYIQRKPDEPGVVVSKVEAGSKASVAGVKPFELITHVNDQPVNSVKDFEKLVAEGGELRLAMKRMAKGRMVTIKTGK